MLEDRALAGRNQPHTDASLQPSLPIGAEEVTLPTMAYNTNSTSTPVGPTLLFNGERLDTTHSNPSQGLLDSDVSQAQYAQYREAKYNEVPRQTVVQARHNDLKWLPIPLRPWFWVPFVVLLALGAVGLEIALHFSKKKQGWPSDGSVERENTAIHYAYTLPPVAVAAMLAAMWTWTDIEIKKLQPYVDLVHGDSPPHRSLLLDYTRSNNFVVWTEAASNKHYLVALASLMVLVSFLFQPLAAALLSVKDVWLSTPDVTVNNLAEIGLNQNLQFNDLSSFLTAAGFAGASVLYGLDVPPFIKGPYTVARFEIPQGIATNGTLFANTTAIKFDTGCQSALVNSTQRQNAPGWINSATLNGCTISWEVDTNATTLFGANIPTCLPEQPPQFSPAVFWFFTYLPSGFEVSATFCTPSFTLLDVNVHVEISSQNLTAVTELRPFSAPSSNFSSLSANVTGPPLNGRAYNGIIFNLTSPDTFTLARQQATQLQLPAAIYQAAVQSKEGLVGSFQANRFVSLSDQVYETYLTLSAREIYFLPTMEPITLQAKKFQKRVLLSDTAVHLLVTAMLLLAIFGTLVHMFHRFDRRELVLKHEPGTIASAVSIGAQTGLGDVLAGRQRQQDISEALQDKKFRIDPRTMKIVMEGEEGYNSAASPLYKRKSIFASLQMQKNSRASMQPLGTPTPGTPSSSA